MPGRKVRVKIFDKLELSKITMCTREFRKSYTHAQARYILIQTEPYKNLPFHIRLTATLRANLDKCFRSVKGQRQSSYLESSWCSRLSCQNIS